MTIIDKYIFEYTKDYKFDYLQQISKHIFDVEIEISVFEYSDGNNIREKAHVTFKKGNLMYECNFCDSHDYENDFFPVVLNGRSFVCFRKTLYGFTLINADTLSVEYEYFPQCVLEGGESFIITDVKQIDGILIFDGCYWAYPFDCFVFDYANKLFLNLSETCGFASVDKTLLNGDSLTIYGADKNDVEKQITITKKDIIWAVYQYGKSDF